MAKLIKKAGAAGAVCSVGTIISIVLSAGNVRTNERGLELIGNAEGCRREAYLCPAAVLTDGIGNTHGVKARVRKTDKEIADDWERNILEAERCVNTYGNGRQLSDNTFSAVTSITFNCGCATMKGSTLFRYLKTGKTEKACSEFPRWVYADGEILPGLVTRRKSEKQLCLDGVK